MKNGFEKFRLKLYKKNWTENLIEDYKKSNLIEDHKRKIKILIKDYARKIGLNIYLFF